MISSDPDNMLRFVLNKMLENNYSPSMHFFNIISPLIIVYLQNFFNFQPISKTERKYIYLLDSQFYTVDIELSLSNQFKLFSLLLYLYYRCKYIVLFCCVSTTSIHVL